MIYIRWCCIDRLSWHRLSGSGPIYFALWTGGSIDPTAILVYFRTKRVIYCDIEHKSTYRVWAILTLIVHTVADTMNRRHNGILLIDDDPCHAKALGEALIDAGESPSNIEWVRTLYSGIERLAHEEVWAIFLNLFLPDSWGLPTIDRLLLVTSKTPVVVLGGADDKDICKAAMLHGAQDYLLEGHVDSYLFARAIQNIIEREIARQELFVEKERAQVTLNSIGDAVLSTDISGNVTYLNVVAERMTGWPREEAVGHPLCDVFQIVDGVTHKPSANPMELAIQQNKTVGLAANCILVRRGGNETPIEDSAAPIHDRDGQVTGAVIVFHDVSMARSMVLEMSHLAQHDVLTDLPNRLLVNDRITQAITMARRNQNRVAVLFLDLDGFKNINDSLGHAIGDKLLQSVATRLSGCVRKSDTVSRQGGDEFVILLSEITHAADAAISAAKMITELKKAHTISEHRLCVTVSIGLSTYPDNGEDAETLIKNADTAMYHAKQCGRDNYQFYKPDMSLRAVERQSLEGQLRYALERNELSLHYQPKVNLKTGAITSVEALLRWQHPERGLLLPAQFLTIAEDTGIIVAIGQWVLCEACRQTREWLDAGLPAVPVAINISSLEFRSEQFLEGVEVALKNTCLDPRYLELELTETVLMRHAEAAASALGQLKAIGVRLAVDDFGVGYSSLSYLTRFPIDALKLDQSFVHNIVDGSDEAIVVSAVISMGKNLKHKVIAEGVETLKQLAFLQAHGCDEGQGYYFSRPVVAQQFAKLLETGISVTVGN
jgi:diguanylate cyclase (GGDEF)-like protein/PAS domain S-box-containing protein